MDSSPAEREFIGAVKDEWIMYSDVAADYTRLSPIGFGASSIVYQAIYHHKNPQTGKVKDLPCALKVLNLDKLAPPALRLLTRETQLMSLNKQPSAPVDEDVVKCILYQALQGLNYLHINGFIHRDIKAANLLVDDDGTCTLNGATNCHPALLVVILDLLANPGQNPFRPRNIPPPKKKIKIKSPPNKKTHEEDAGQNGMMNAVRNGFGGSTGGPLIYGARPPKPTTTDTTGKSTIKKRKSFVGTPSWMAPEVITQQHYDSSADIWSLGITVIEMCMGRAPGSRERDVKRVLLSTLQNAPPTLDRDAGKFKYSKGLKEFVDSCLVKDPAQ
ncbi:hypothetical protein FRC00_013436, partial [Tulasnella sp. 408]